MRFLFYLILACHFFLPALSYAITNGYPTFLYPGVVSLTLIVSSSPAKCTGTVIGPNAILTAAHCLKNATLGAIYQKNGEPIFISDQVVIPKEYSDLENQIEDLKMESIAEQIMHKRDLFEDAPEISTKKSRLKFQQSFYDLAIAIVNDATLPPPVPILQSADTKEFLNQEITLVGYGRNDLRRPLSVDDRFPTKRMGTNRILIGWENLFFYLSTIHPSLDAFGGYLHYSDGKWAGNGNGDSGGPVLFQNKVIGVISHISGTEDPDVNSMYCSYSIPQMPELIRVAKKVDFQINTAVSLSSPWAKKFLEEAKEQGARF